METNQTVTVNPTQSSSPTSVTQSATKKGFPTKLIAIIGSALLLIVVAVFAITSMTSKKQTATSGEITWWGLWEDETIVKQVIADYQAKNPNIKIKYVRQSKEDYRERLTSALAKGTAPDIFRFHNTWTPMFKSELDKMPASVYSVSDFTTSFYPVALSDLTVGSSLVGVPLEYDGINLFINEEIFEKEGKSAPNTWPELRETARALTTKQNGDITQAGVALGRTENVDHWPEILALMMLQNGVDMNKPTGKLAEDALNYYTIFSEEDEVWDATLPSSTVAFAGGKLAMYFGPSWRAFEIRLQNPSLRFKTIPVPQLPKTAANEPDVNYASYWAEGVWVRSKNKTASWNFLKYISSKEVLEKMYNQASKQRMFGEPYPKQDMEILLKDHPIIGSTVTGAKTAQTWFLQSKTWDGPTGINSQITKYFEDAVNFVNTGKEAKVALETVSSGVIQVLSQYGIKIQ